MCIRDRQYTLPEEEVMFLLSQGTIRNQAIKEVAKKWGIERRILYERITRWKQQEE